MKADFDGILRKHGHNVVLQRRHDETGTGPYLEIAGGKYEPTAERWTTWRGIPQEQDAMKPDGFVTNVEAPFYFQSECRPKMSDLIMEDTPHERNQRTTYVIEYVRPFYNGAEVIYYKATVNKLEPNS